MVPTCPTLTIRSVVLTNGVVEHNGLNQLQRVKHQNQHISCPTNPKTKPADDMVSLLQKTHTLKALAAGLAGEGRL